MYRKLAGAAVIAVVAYNAGCIVQYHKMKRRIDPLARSLGAYMAHAATKAGVTEAQHDQIVEELKHLSFKQYL